MNSVNKNTVYENRGSLLTYHFHNPIVIRAKERFYIAAIFIGKVFLILFNQTFDDFVFLNITIVAIILAFLIIKVIIFLLKQKIIIIEISL